MNFKSKLVSIRHKDTTNGFSLVEVIIYISILVMLLLVVINALVSIQQTRQQAILSNRLSQSAITAFERMSRDISRSESVDVGASTFDSHPGVLELDTASTSPQKIRFYISGGRLVVSEDGVELGELTRDSVFVDELIFRHIESGSSTEAVKIEMSMITGTSTATTTQNFYLTEVLRRSYE